MFNFTPFVKPLMSRRIRAIRRTCADVGDVQRRQLAWLLRRAARTEWGRAHNYGSLASYGDFCAAVPITDYPHIRPLVMRMIAGEPDILWPGVTRRFAQSSGTSDGKSKFIPVTDDSLRLSHYRGGFDVVARYMDLYPDSRIFSGRSFILGGSFANELRIADPRVKVGDLSANLIDAINPLAEMFRVPDKTTALLPDWHRKLPLLVDKASRADITNISGVPSWFLTVLRGILDHTGATHIHQVWPHLEVFFHGGIAFGPYRSQYDAIIDPQRMRYLETYNASEGFFAIQDTIGSPAMRLQLDAATFYEFIPLNQPSARPIPAWDLEAGRTYALVISSANGLWRYPIGDTVRVETLDPLRIVIAGRTRHFINAFGEEVMVYNTDAAITRACAATGAEVLNYTVAPVYAQSGNRGRHQWLIEFSRQPADIEAFADILDRMLADENSDYQAKRSGNIFLDRLSIVKATPGLFDRWLESTGKLGGQRKVPRLSNDRKIMDRLIEMNAFTTL